MIEQNGISCDKCRNYEPCPHVPFRTKIRRITDKGWRIIKRRNVIRHYCPDCIPVENLKMSSTVKTSNANLWWMNY